jgi:hypothetical protein
MESPSRATIEAMADESPLVVVCIDDTDRPGTRSTARLALSILELLAPRYRCHSLTTHPHLLASAPSWKERGNHSACMRFLDEPGLDLPDLVHEIRCLILEDQVEGSNPGLCAGRRFAPPVLDFAHRSRSERLELDEARALASASDLILEGLAGDGRGMIGALAGAGMAAAGGPGSYLQIGDAPIDLGGLLAPRKLRALGIDRFVDVHSGQDVPMRPLWVERKLHPSMVYGQPTVMVETTESGSLAFVHRDLR